MGLSDGIIKVRFFELSFNCLELGAWEMIDLNYSPVIRAIGEAFLAELKDRFGPKEIDWHVIDLRNFSEAELTLAETQFAEMIDAAPEPLPGYFGSFKLTVHHELLRRSGPELQ